jgi:hypothetical protein
VQLVEQRERVVEGLEQVLVVLDHLAPHVDAEPLLVAVQLVAIEHVLERELALGDEPREVHRALEAERDRLEVRRADRRVAREEHGRGCEWMVGRPCEEPSPAGRVPGAVEVEGDPHDLEVAEELALGLLLDLVDEAVHRLGDAREVPAEPLAVESSRHRLEVVGGDVDDARDVADAAVVVRPADHRDELVVRALDVLVVLAVFVAVVWLAVQERDHERVLQPDVERVRALGRVGAEAGHEVIAQE